MVRENRIKEYIFNQTFSAATVNTYYSDYPLNGEILSVDVNYNNVGSVSLQLSGTAVEFYSSLLASGTNWSHSQPREFSSSTTGSIANAEHVPFVVHEPIAIVVGSMSSGTTPLQVVVRYR